MQQNYGYIRITSVPPGEAPLAVREQWVGLILPLAKPGLRNSASFGVLSGPKTAEGALSAVRSGNVKRTIGYYVFGAAAVEILSKSSPAAARWWRDNVPSLTEQTSVLIFQQECCVPISAEETVWPPPPWYSSGR